MTKLRSMAILMLLISFSLFAQDQKPAADAQGGAPKQSPEMQKLVNMMAGRWQVTMTMEPNEQSPKPLTVRATSNIRSGPGGLAVIEDARARQSPLGPFAGHGVIWFDPQQKLYHGLWCDNWTPMGCDNAGSGNWQGDNLVMTSDNEMWGKKLKMRHTYTDITPDSYTYKIEAGPDENSMKLFLTIKYVKATKVAADQMKKGGKEE